MDPRAEAGKAPGVLRTACLGKNAVGDKGPAVSEYLSASWRCFKPFGVDEKHLYKAPPDSGDPALPKHFDNLACGLAAANRFPGRKPYGV